MTEIEIVGGALSIAAAVIIGMAMGSPSRYSKKNPFIAPERCQKRPELHTGECFECGDWRDDCIKCKHCGEYVCCQGIQITNELEFRGETTTACVYQHANFHCSRGWKRPAKKKAPEESEKAQTEAGPKPIGETA